MFRATAVPALSSSLGELFGPNQLGAKKREDKGVLVLEGLGVCDL